MRAEDVAELAALNQQPLPALVESLRASELALALVVGGQVAAMFGVGQLPGVSARVGQAWVLTGEAVTAHPKVFLKTSRLAVAQLLELYPVLFNLVDTRYTASLRWLQWLGFEIGAPLPFGPTGVLFAPAQLRKEAWAR